MKIYENGEVIFIKEYKDIDITTLTDNEIICLYAFQLALIKNDENDLCRLFSFRNYGEDSICIYKKFQNWEVYIGQRGHTHIRKIFDNCVTACMTAIHMLSDDKELEKQLLYDFSYYLSKDYLKEELNDLKVNDKILKRYDK